MKSFMGWIGGKRLLRDKIIKRFPDNFDRYIEVFGGAAWVLFHKDKHANMEVYNDYNSDLVNLFRCIKYHGDELLKELKYMLNSREMFDDFLEQCFTRGMTDIQRAARFFMLVKTSYGSKRTSYGCVKKNIAVAKTYLNKIQARLNSVVIENRDFERLVKVYDRPNALFYLDPPYYGSEKYYQVKFSENDHKRLANTLCGLKGQFILTYNNCEHIKDLYGSYNIDEVSRSNNLAVRYESNQYRELIIRNY